MAPRWMLPALLLALLVAPLASAADTAPVLIKRVDAGQLAADAGRSATAVFALSNLNPSTDFYVSLSADPVGGWEPASIQPNDFTLPARAGSTPASTNVTLTFAPQDQPREGATFHVTIQLVNTATGGVTEVGEDVLVASAAPPRVLAEFKNPLGAPLDNAWGTFLLDMTFWIAVAIAAIFVGNWLIRAITLRAAKYVSSEMASKLRLPLFLFVLSLGLSKSVAILPRNFFTQTVARIALAVGVGVFGLYVLYKLLDAALFYYEKEIAPRTETTMDDVIIPVVRKVGVVVLYVVGIVISLKELGWDPTIIFAGAGIAGLVIAFAAQDTFSNLFSGVFLMLDQPFKEGDVILLETGEVARVESIGLRTTKLYEYDHHHSIILPNNQLATKRIVNYSAPDPFFKVDIMVGVAYGSEPAKVERILRQVAAAEGEIMNEGPWGPQVQLRSFADSSLDFMLRVTLKDPRDRNRVPSKLRAAILAAFEREGVEIPFPHRTLIVKSDAGKVLTPDAPGEPRSKQR